MLATRTRKLFVALVPTRLELALTLERWNTNTKLALRRADESDVSVSASLRGKLLLRLRERERESESRGGLARGRKKYARLDNFGRIAKDDRFERTEANLDKPT